MLLKAEQIANELAEADRSGDPFMITPLPDLESLRATGAASIDLRLGCWFVTLRQTRAAILKIGAEAGDSPSEMMLTKPYYVPFGKEFVLHPRSFVLGATLEWIRLPKDRAGYIVVRSSWGRRGLVIATASGVHPGFTGCLTLEISNIGEIPIAIAPGMAICQLFVHEVRHLSDSDLVDRSMFVGLRKPVLGRIDVDEVARKLAGISKEAKGSDFHPS